MTSFVVEQAGCASCAERIRRALTALGEVAEISVDEDGDVSHVRMAASDGVTEERVNAVLLAASEGAGHAYRIRAGSFEARARRS